MERSRSIVTLLTLAASAALPLASASAQPSTPRTLTYEFSACSGPPGTPTEFDAVKQPGGAAALHTAEGGSIFIAVAAEDVETGAVLFTTPGFRRNGLPTVTCSVVDPTSGREQLVTGLIVPAG